MSSTLSIKKTNPCIQTLLLIEQNNPDYLLLSLDKVEKYFSGELKPPNEESVFRPSDDQLSWNGEASAFGASLTLANYLQDSGDKLESLCADLEKLGLPVDYRQKMTSIIAAYPKPPRKTFDILPHFRSCAWSVDVSISSSHLLKLLEPSVRLTLESESGLIKTMQLTTQQFSQLRYKVAEALNTLFELQKHKPFNS